ncbi:MAG: hypothetical protein JSV89_17470 [Spirochaetaceae bacterium]|nr:MAG: hypothetical protein JSV89_17470 [Spirochaetaceae bacterium]
MRNPSIIRRDLKQATAASKAAFKRFIKALRESDAEAERAQYEEAERKIIDLRRELANATGEEWVVPLELGFEPEPSISEGLVKQNREGQLVLGFDALCTNSEELLEDVFVTLEFDRIYDFKLGGPNDEGLRWHPLINRGLQAYSCLEVLNSTWVDQVKAQNGVAFPDSETRKVRHFIFTFKENTFECLTNEVPRCRLDNDWYDNGWKK